MKHSLLITVAVIALSNVAFSQTKHDSTLWLTEINKAYDIQRSTGKPIFAFFTGSDWCVWCHKLQAEVFAKPAFKEWANSEVVLLELDYPKRKPMPANLAQQNETLKNVFKISGFPTIWLFCISEDKEKEKHLVISPYGSLGYPSHPVQGKEEVTFLENAKNILASRSCPIVESGQ